MKEFISDLGVIPSASGPMKIFCDNIGAIAWQRNPDFTRGPSTSRDASIHPKPSPGGRHRDLQDTYGSEFCRPVD